MESFPAWLVPLLLALGVMCIGIGAAPVRRHQAAWIGAGIVLGGVALVLTLIAAVAAP
ncbi:MAG TPA: hypothetical protein VL915_05635 [Gemmatimonadales bacterium]|nr:hypothetical protein [Gemmatimonadales bacterium]